MNRRKRKCIMFCFAFICGLCKTEAWTKFTRETLLDGGLCEGTDVAFTKSGIRENLNCLLECVNNGNCFSVYYDQTNEICTGCVMIYDTTNSPTGVTGSGTIYFWLNKCPDGWFIIDDSCYFVTEAMPYNDGKMFCYSQYSYPMRIETVEEHTKMKEKLWLITGTTGVYFAAYTDIETEGVWVDDIGRELTIDSWGGVEPNGLTAQNCLAFWEGTQYNWVDVSCHDDWNTLCETDAIGN